jgi:hypothetical protein
MGFEPAVPPDEQREVLTPSVIDRNLVPLPGHHLQLLAGPVELPLDDLADVLGVLVDPEVAADHLLDAVGRTELGPPAVGPGALQEQLFEPAQLVGAQSGRPARIELGGDLRRGLELRLQPGVDGGTAAAEGAGDIGGMLAPADELDGTPAAAFEFFCGSDRSHT